MHSLSHDRHHPHAPSPGSPIPPLPSLLLRPHARQPPYPHHHTATSEDKQSKQEGIQGYSFAMHLEGLYHAVSLLPSHSSLSSCLSLDDSSSAAGEGWLPRLVNGCLLAPIRLLHIIIPKRGTKPIAFALASPPSSASAPSLSPSHLLSLLHTYTLTSPLAAVGQARLAHTIEASGELEGERECRDKDESRKNISKDRIPTLHQSLYHRTISFFCLLVNLHIHRLVLAIFLKQIKVIEKFIYYWRNAQQHSCRSSSSSEPLPLRLWHHVKAQKERWSLSRSEVEAEHEEEKEEKNHEGANKLEKLLVLHREFTIKIGRVSKHILLLEDLIDKYYYSKQSSALADAWEIGKVSGNGDITTRLQDEEQEYLQILQKNEKYLKLLERYVLLQTGLHSTPSSSSPSSSSSAAQLPDDPSSPPTFSSSSSYTAPTPLLLSIISLLTTIPARYERILEAITPPSSSSELEQATHTVDHTSVHTAAAAEEKSKKKTHQNRHISCRGLSPYDFYYHHRFSPFIKTPHVLEYWLYYSLGVITLSAAVYFGIKYKKEIKRFGSDLVKSNKLFLQEHLVEPIRNIYQSTFSSMNFKYLNEFAIKETEQAESTKQYEIMLRDISEENRKIYFDLYTNYYQSYMHQEVKKQTTTTITPGSTVPTHSSADVGTTPASASSETVAASSSGAVSSGNNNSGGTISPSSATPPLPPLSLPPCDSLPVFSQHLNQLISNGTIYNLLIEQYTNEINQPLKNLLFGTITQSTLIQLHKLKLDSTQLLLSADRLLNSQLLLLNIMTIIPTILLFWGAFRLKQYVFPTKDDWHAPSVVYRCRFMKKIVGELEEIYIRNLNKQGGKREEDSEDEERGDDGGENKSLLPPSSFLSSPPLLLSSHSYGTTIILLKQLLTLSKQLPTSSSHSSDYEEINSFTKNLLFFLDNDNFDLTDDAPPSSSSLCSSSSTSRAIAPYYHPSSCSGGCISIFQRHVEFLSNLLIESGSSSTDIGNAIQQRLLYIEWMRRKHTFLI